MSQAMDEQVPDGLRCEFLDNPMGVQEAHPRLSWRLPAGVKRQTAFRVLAATRPDRLAPDLADLWDSGKVETAEQLGLPYGGRELVTLERCWWTVCIWDEQGVVSGWSEAAFWEAGLLARADWSARWIGSPLCGGTKRAVPVPYLRKQFAVEAGLVRARLAISALGLYDCTLNGKLVTQDVLAPGWTDYSKRVQYRVYDVTEQLQEGDNAIGVLLGDGWYCGKVSWYDRQFYGDRPKLLAQVVLDYADGRRDVVCSDGSWKTATGAILASDLMAGESVDAGLALQGWDEPGFDDCGWAGVVCFADPGIVVSPCIGPPVRRVKCLKPLSVERIPGDKRYPRYLVDMGQNMVGWLRLRLNGPAGVTLEIRHAEVLDAHGMLYTANLRGAAQRDDYTLRGGGEEIFEPRFTFHGFRYAEITVFMRARKNCEVENNTPADCLVALTPETIEGVVLCSDMAQTGHFSSSDPLVNQLQSNIQWGQRGNFVDVPTDCPQRDERLGWTGDAQVFCATACFNMDAVAFFRKWMRDLCDGQLPNGDFPKVAPNVLDWCEAGDKGWSGGGPAWSDAAVIVPWTVYQRYGDRRILEDSWPALRRFIGYLVEKSEGLVHPDQGFGDWLSSDGPSPIEALTPRALIGTAFLAHDARLMGCMADVLGDAQAAREYQDLHMRVRKAFQQRFFTDDGLLCERATQTGYVLALHFDLLDDAQRSKAVEALAADITGRGMKLSTGFVGTPYLNPVLSAAGRDELAYGLLLQREYPSWLYSVCNGATTIWERWDGWTSERGFQDAGMNSFNHYAYGAIGQWLYEHVAGLAPAERPDGLAYRTLRIEPRPGGALTQAAASYETPYGLAASAWELEDGRFRLAVTIPPGASALVRLPDGSEHAAEVGQHQYECSADVVAAGS